MRPFKGFVSILCSYVLLAGLLPGQSAIRIEPAHGGLGWLTRPYQQRSVPPINLSNSSRLEQLVRAGNLYLSAQDVIALALENNLDIEVQRYAPLLAAEVLKRAQSGQQLRSIDTAIAAGPTSVSLTGVSVNASGGTTGAGSAASATGGVLTNLGPPLLTLDPQLSFSANFGHTTSPSSNTVFTGTTALTQDYRTFRAGYSQSWDFGMNAALTYGSSYNHYNSFNYFLNPYESGFVDLTITQNFLNGFGRAVNGRNIRVQKNNVKFSDLQFKQQVITTVSAILNLYWDLVAFNQDVRAKQHELDTAQALFNDNKKQVEIGTLPAIEVTRAEAQVYTSQQDLLISQTNLRQQETVLKNALSRNGVASPTVADVRVVPLDYISVPKSDNLPPLADLVNDAMSKRVEIAQGNLNIESNKLLLKGIKNGLLPTLNGFVDLTNNGLAGAQANIAADPFLVGGYGNMLGQIFRRNYPSYAAGVSLNIPLRNRAAQGDYVSTQLQLRQSELQMQKQINQVRVDVQNAVIGLQQARVRYEAAVKARILQEQTLEAEKKKYTLGASTVFNVVTDEQNLATAEGTEVTALANYSHARVQLDESIGTTLEVNHISIDEALKGEVARKSGLPDKLPAATELKQQSTEQVQQP
jgi:outer membrane protein